MMLFFFKPTFIYFLVGVESKITPVALKKSLKKTCSKRVFSKGIQVAQHRKDLSRHLSMERLQGCKAAYPPSILGQLMMNP